MSLVDYCVDSRQRRVIELSERGWRAVDIAEELGMFATNVRRSIRRVRARAAEKGYDPEHGLNRSLPDGFTLSGFADMRTNEEGKPIWYKASRDKERQRELLEQAIETFSAEMPRQSPIEKPTDNYQDMIAVIPFADLHVGMYAWASESGQSFDLSLAKRDMYAAVDYLLGCSPPARRGVLLNLGDLFHTTNQEGTTKRSGHVLDMAGRFPQMVETGVDIIRYMIMRMLEVFETVDVVMTPGNHDEELAKVLSVMLRHVYENEPRLTIHRNESQRCYIEDGAFLMGAVHGHETKESDLMSIMAAEMPEAWGRSRCRRFFHGHTHHDSEVEYRGGKVFRVRKLSPSDAYERGHGYLSGNDLKLIIYNRNRNTEQSRFTCGLDVVRSLSEY